LAQLASSLIASSFTTELEDAIKGGFDHVSSVQQGLAAGAELTLFEFVCHELFNL